jgi:hypothetical protein
VGVGLELALEVGDLRPGLEVVVDVLAVLYGDHLRRLLEEHRERAPRADHPNRRVEAVQDEHFLLKDYQCGHPYLRASIRKVRFCRIVVKPLRAGQTQLSDYLFTRARRARSTRG